jgi:phosphomannomutase/phosphoglucomutase
MKKLFREYDIRGIADQELTNPFTWALGRSLAEIIIKAGDNKAYIGQDVRASSPRLANALSAGLEAGGVKTRQITPGPTPLLYYSCVKAEKNFETKTGIMITGSHNPAEYNGFKMVIAGNTIHGEDITGLYSLVEKHIGSAPNDDFSDNPEQSNRYSDYINYVAEENISSPLKNKIKVVVDAGNGAGGPLAVELYKKMGCEVTELYCDFDSSFPNHHPDPTIPANLQDLIAKVKEVGADIGVAFDGDGDRIGAVSPKGEILFGDQLLLYFTNEILKTEKNPTVISEVKASQMVFDKIADYGATPIIWKTGHSLIKAKLKETGAAIAGEMSGHMFFAHRYFGFDDAVYSAARLLEALSENHPATIDEFLESLPHVENTPEFRVDCDDEKKFAVVEQFVAKAKETFGAENILDIDGARVKFPHGWGLMRSSNTQPVIVMRFEASSKEKLKEIRDEFAKILKSIDSSIEVPLV